LNNSTIGNTTAAAASFTTISATGASSLQAITATSGSFGTTLEVDGAAQLDGNVTLGTNNSNTTTINSKISMGNGSVITDGLSSDESLIIETSNASKRALSLNSNVTTNTHNKSILEISDVNTQTSTEFYALNLNTKRGGVINAISLGNMTPNAGNDYEASFQYRTESPNADDIAMLVTHGNYADGNAGTALNLRSGSSVFGNVTSASFTAIKVTDGRLVWSTKSVSADADATLDGAYTMQILSADFTAIRTFTLPGASAVDGQIVYVAYNDTNNSHAGAVAAGGTATIVGSTVLTDNETAAFIFSNNVWYRLN
jgi:hypothetical protein